MSSDREFLYELTPLEFERLCADILKAQRFDRVELVGGPRDQGVDIIGESEGETVAVQVKHSKRLSPSVIRDSIARMESSTYQAKQFIFITSAPLSASHRSEVEHLLPGLNVKLLGPDEIIKALGDHPEIGGSSVIPARKRRVRQRLGLFLGVIGGATSIVGLLVSVFAWYLGPTKPELQERIESVERAIRNLNDLEAQLADIRADMLETEKAKKVLEEEYAKAQELERITDAQFQAVRTALRTQSWQKTMFDYLLGFILGVAASLTASVIYSRVRQRRALVED